MAEDDPDIRDVLKIVFENQYQITFFSTGESILNNDFEMPDVFLLDRQLPDQDGLEICRFLKHQEATMNIPVVIISGSNNIKTLAIDAGADAVIEKPFTIKQLRQVVNSLL